MSESGGHEVCWEDLHENGSTTWADNGVICQHQERAS